MRISKVVRHIGPDTRILDIGCHDGALFRRLVKTNTTGLGIDSHSVPERTDNRFEFVQGHFPADLTFETAAFDTVCALAVMEHVPEPELGDFVKSIHMVLKPGGTAILTVPSPLVDTILDILISIRLISGMETEQHHAFDVGQVVPLFEGQGFVLLLHRRFQLGLNNLFVFRRVG